jgi:hypothetical protein
MDCTALTRGFRYLTCTTPDTAGDGSAPSRSAIDMVFAFDSSGRLVALDRLTRHLTAKQAGELASERAAALERLVGPADEENGEFQEDALREAFTSAMIGYRFRDRVVRVMATNIPGSGVVVRELAIASLAPTAQRGGE